MNLLVIQTTPKSMASGFFQIVTKIAMSGLFPFLADSFYKNENVQLFLKAWNIYVFAMYSRFHHTFCLLPFLVRVNP